MPDNTSTLLHHCSSVILLSLMHTIDVSFMDLLVGCTALCGECNNLDKCDECAYENMYKDTVEGVTTCHGEFACLCIPVTYDCACKY